MSTTQRGTQVRLPKLGESVTEGTLGAWLKNVGDQVEKYEPLVEITTDKVAAEIPSPIAGRLIQISAEEGETLPVGAEICVIDESGDTVEAVGAQAGETAQPADTTPTPAAPNGAQASVRSTERVRPDDYRDVGEVLRLRSSPAVRRIAAEQGIDIRQIQGSGIEGRVTKSDILNFIEQQGARPRAAEPAATAAPEREAQAVEATEQAIQETVSPPQPAERPTEPETRAMPTPTPLLEPGQPLPERQRVQVFEGDRIVPITAMRRQIAEHMVRSERTAPHVTTWMEVDMSGIVEARNRQKERFARDEGFDLTYLPFVIKATVHALREHPAVNAVWDEDQIIQRKAVNIGVAVSLDDGLIVPVIKNADEKSIAGIARAMRDLVGRARTSRLTFDDVQGGTFTVNNPGTFGTVMSTPIIVQPQAAILSTEAIIKRPVVVDEMFAIRPMMNLSLSIDHRILDGMIAARFLGEIKRWLESFRPDDSLY